MQVNSRGPSWTSVLVPRIMCIVFLGCVLFGGGYYVALLRNYTRKSYPVRMSLVVVVILTNSFNVCDRTSPLSFEYQFTA
jgi:hypothetical protein